MQRPAGGFSRLDIYGGTGGNGGRGHGACRLSFLLPTTDTIKVSQPNTKSVSPSSASKLRRASVMPTQILIYEDLISCLKDACDAGIPGRSLRHAQLHTTLDGYLLSMASDNVVSGIVESVRCLKTLLELSVELGLANDSKLRMALRRDGQRIATLLRSIFASKSLEEAVLRLEGDSAQCFLDVVQDTLDKGFLLTPEDDRMARRIIRKLACRSDTLPSALFITGITGKAEHPTFGGGFADIFRASYNNRIVALKYMRVIQYMRGSDSRNVRLKFCREALVWKELCHPHILPFLGIEKDSFPWPLCMVSPWMEHGTVLNYLKQHGHSNVDKLLHEIAQGLQYLHSRDIVHGDLRGANILVNDDWSACLADFGLSIFSDATSLLTTNRGGSAYWMAPELLDPDRFGMRFARTPASDVYSFGCVCLELYTGRPPFSGILPEPGAMMKVINGERPPRPSSSPAMSDSLWNYVSTYWAQDPKIRPAMQVVAQNMFWPQPPPEEERPTVGGRHGRSAADGCNTPNLVSQKDPQSNQTSSPNLYSAVSFDFEDPTYLDFLSSLFSSDDISSVAPHSPITRSDLISTSRDVHGEDTGANAQDNSLKTNSSNETEHPASRLDEDFTGKLPLQEGSSTSKLAPRRDVWPPLPPATKSKKERLARVEAEREAKRVSDAIDEALALEREQTKRNAKIPKEKIVLLGQAESGKSTILKNLQLHFAPKAFQAEAEGWRPVIHLNLVRSVNFVLGLLEIRHPSTYNGDAQPISPDDALNGQLRRLSISLAPLRQVEETLSNRIAGSRPPEDSRERDRYHPAKAPEISLRSGSGWTTFLRFWRGSSSMPDGKEKAEELQTRRILSACAEDIMTLWAAPEVQQGLKDREIVLQEQSGLWVFLTVAFSAPIHWLMIVLAAS
ncbi:Kinase-like protein [Mycena sanguinolenta]|uniref:Kinase-like protein n=1 Tax=Mycena sanguinolenta TaxID=230812 RepID=A0A8H6ZBC1_9AGAR|nr:Kinase-like protein [Mycena sanguinolenta]